MIAPLVRIAALFVKEVEVVFRDPRSRFVVLVPPLIQLFVFAYAASFDVEELPFVVLDEDRSEASRDLLSRFAASSAFEPAGTVDGERQLGLAIESGRALFGIRIGQRFSEDLVAGRSPQVQLLLDGRESNTALVAVGVSRSILETFSRERLSESGRRPVPPRLLPRAWFNPNLKSRWFFVPGIVVLLSLVVTLVLTALSVAREREEGTFDQLLVTPFRSLEILAGKALPAAAVGMAEALAIVLLARIWFHIPYVGSVAWLFAALGAWLAAAVGLGLFISALARTQQQAVLFAFLFLVPTILLSGFATPVENMPDWMQRVTWWNPMRHCLVLVRGLFLADPGRDLIVAHLRPMLVVAAGSLALSAWLFRARAA